MSEPVTNNPFEQSVARLRDTLRAQSEQLDKEQRARSNSDERRILLPNVPWSAYVVLRDTLDSAGVRLTYLKGSLEIMIPSRKHKVYKKQVARLLELFCLERDIALYGYGPMTIRHEEKERGFDADECYSRGRAREVPEVALEMPTTKSLLDKFVVYRGLGVREVWVYWFGGQFYIHALRGKRYERVETSEVFPELDLAAIGRYAEMPDQHIALCALRDELRAR